MVAELLKLKLSVLGNSLMRVRRENLGVLFAFLLCLALAMAAGAALLGLRTAAPADARTDVVIGGSLVIAAFLLVPLISGVSDTLDPRRFELFGIPTKTLALWLAVAGLLSVPVVLLVVVCLLTLVTFSATAGTMLLALVSAVLVISTCVLGSRIAFLLAGLFLATPRAREAGGILGVTGLLLLSPLVVFWVSQNWGPGGSGVLTRVASVLSWTPLGAAWAIPAETAAGASGGIIVAKFLVAAATAGLLFVAWRSLVLYASTTVQRRPHIAIDGRLGWFHRLPATRTGAVAARSLTYWARDARYPVPLVGVFIFLFVAYAAFIVVGVPLTVLILLTIPALCITLVFSVHNDLALDNTAVWLHVSAGKLGIPDRAGRMAPILGIGIPLIAVGSVGSAYFAGNYGALPALLGVSTCLLLAGLGVGNVLSAAFPYPAVRPGDSPFAQPQAPAGSGFIVQVTFLVVTFVLAAPSIAFAVMGLLGNPGLLWTSLWWGVGVGLVTVVAGTVLGGATFDRRGPELLAAALRN